MSTPSQFPPPSERSADPSGYPAADPAPTADPARYDADQYAPATSAQETGDRPVGFDNKGRVKRGAVSALWVGIIAAAVLLILLIIFIAQNLTTAPIHYLGASGHMAIGLMLLLAAIGGVLLAAIPGTIRILQLRKALKKNTPKEQRIR